MLGEILLGVRPVLARMPEIPCCVLGSRTLNEYDDDDDVIINYLQLIIRTIGPLSEWKASGWHHNGSVAKRPPLPGMGRHMPRYICSIPLTSLEHCRWCSSSRGRNQKENQICRFATPHRLYTHHYRNNGCLGE